MKYTYSRIISVAICLFLSIPVFSQIVNNGSFEGERGIGIPTGWNACNSSSTPDIQPDTWDVELLPKDGNSYLGLVCRGSFISNSYTCEEVQQDLNINLETGKCYKLDVYLAYSDIFEYTEFLHPISLRVFAGNQSCSENFLLSEFGPVENTSWKKFTTYFTPQNNFSHLWLKAHSITNPISFGNILVDHLTIKEFLAPEPTEIFICDNQPQELIPIESDSNGEVDFLWSTGETSNSIFVNEANNYYVDISAGGCTVRQEFIVLAPEPPIIDLGSDSTLCTGDSIILNTFSDQNVVWNTGSHEKSITVYTSGVYQVSISNECYTSTDQIRITFEDDCCKVKIPADVTIPDMTEQYFCKGETIELKGITLNNNEFINYEWNTGETTPNILIKTPGLYYADVSIGLCSFRQNFLTIQPEEINLSLGVDTVLCSGDSLILNAGSDLTYQWNTGSQDSKIVVYESGTYKVDVQNHCFEESDEINIQFEENCCKITAPNAFTPNNDGINDTFDLSSNTWFDQFEIKIFNRWGKELFSSNDINYSWTAQDVPASVYYWVAKISCSQRGKKIDRKYNGTVHVLK